MHVVFGDRIEDKLPRITAPSLVVRGEGDALVPQHWAEEVARRLQAGEVRVVLDAGHAPHYGSADELMRIIRPFLDQPSRESRSTRPA
jgi:pimeloyl-ACP methyl ester carboxylesterase